MPSMDLIPLRRAQAKPQNSPPKKAAAAKPRTLSDIPGGAVPASDPVEEFAQMSADRLGGAQMANMTTDQISALLNRLG